VRVCEAERSPAFGDSPLTTGEVKYVNVAESADLVKGARVRNRDRDMVRDRVKVRVRVRVRVRARARARARLRVRVRVRARARARVRVGAWRSRPTNRCHWR